METKITPEREKELEVGRIAGIKLWGALFGGSTKAMIKALRAEGYEDAANEVAEDQARYDAARGVAA